MEFVNCVLVYLWYLCPKENEEVLKNITIQSKRTCYLVFMSREGYAADPKYATQCMERSLLVHTECQRSLGHTVG